jgi:hypothetical protein
MKKVVSIFILVSFCATSIMGPNPVYAQELRLPVPGVLVPLSPEFNPPILKGIKVHPDNPFRFDFILDVGDGSKPSQQGRIMNPPLQEESTRLIKYFLASLTIPEKDLWVNLSPYEKNRIVPESFGQTEMGRDLLAEDYMLKQITASLIYPEGETGKKFWKRIYEEAAKKFGTTNIPVNTFNKVWIVPEKAVVYENAKAGTAYIVESRLKVMLEQDYLALSKSVSLRGSEATEAISKRTTNNDINALGSQIVREIVIPELTKEVNENRNFAQLRQVYNSLILAAWYKKKIKDSILEQVYADKNKIQGLVIPAKAGIQNKNNVEYIYKQYLQAFKKGVYNYIKEELDPSTQQPIPRKYFSGGASMYITTDILDTTASSAMVTQGNTSGLETIAMRMDPAIKNPDRAMFSKLFKSPASQNGEMVFKKKRFFGESAIFREVKRFSRENQLDLAWDSSGKGEESIVTGLEYLVENLYQHEYHSKFQSVYFRIYRSFEPNDGIRLEFWGPRKHKLPHQLLGSVSYGKEFRWFDYNDPPWSTFEAKAPESAITGGRWHEGVVRMLRSFWKSSLHGRYGSIKVGWRVDAKSGGNIIAVHFPIITNSTQLARQGQKSEESGDQAMGSTIKSKNILVIPSASDIGADTPVQMRKFFKDHEATTIPLYERAAQKLGQDFSIDRLLLGSLAKDRTNLIVLCIAYALYVYSQYEVLKQKFKGHAPTDFITGNSIGLLISMVISGALTMDDLMIFFKNGFDEMERKTKTTDYGIVQIPSLGPERVQKVLEQGRIEVINYNLDHVSLVVSGDKRTVDETAAVIAQKLEIPLNNIKVIYPPGVKGVHHSFYGPSVERRLLELVGQIQFKDTQIPIIDSSDPQTSILHTADQVRKAFYRTILGPVYWAQVNHLISDTSNRQLTISSDIGSLTRLEAYTPNRATVYGKGKLSFDQLRELVDAEQKRAGTMYLNAAEWFVPYLGAGLDEDQMKEIIFLAFHHESTWDSDFPLQEVQKSAIEKGVGIVASHGAKQLTITSMGVGFSPMESVRALEIALKELNKSPNQVETITLKYYDNNVSILNDINGYLSMILPPLLHGSYKDWKGKIKVEAFYADFINGMRNAKVFRKVITPSNIILFRYTWITNPIASDEVLSAGEFLELLDILRASYSQGALIVDEVSQDLLKNRTIFNEFKQENQVMAEKKVPKRTRPGPKMSKKTKGLIKWIKYYIKRKGTNVVPYTWGQIAQKRGMTSGKVAQTALRREGIRLKTTGPQIEHRGTKPSRETQVFRDWIQLNPDTVEGIKEQLKRHHDGVLRKLADTFHFHSLSRVSQILHEGDGETENKAQLSSQNKRQVTFQRFSQLSRKEQVEIWRDIKKWTDPVDQGGSVRPFFGKTLKWGSNGADAIIAFKDGRPVGVLGFHAFPEAGYALGRGLIVHDGERGNNTALKLSMTLFKYLKEEGYETFKFNFVDLDQIQRVAQKVLLLFNNDDVKIDYYHGTSKIYAMKIDLKRYNPDDKVGGIDLTPAKMNVEIKTGSSTKMSGDDNGGIKFHLDPAMLERLKDAPGFVPVIIKIQPVTNLRMFLGINDPVGVDKLA